MALNKGDDHWAFLEEIEAPMWVDLNLEAKINNQDVNDEWFRTSHPVHQCPSSELKSALSLSGDGETVVDYSLPGPPSPKNSNSVSRSRGNEFKSQKWRENGCKLFSNKERQVKAPREKSSREERKPKSSFSKLKRTSDTRLIHESRSDEKSKANYSNPIPSSSNSASSLNSKVDEAVGSSSSTVTSVNNQEQQQNFPEVSRLEINNNSRLLEVMKITLRKSCATRQPSRVEVNKDKRESNVRKSLSGKSSVDSSCNPSQDVKNLKASSIMVKEITPDSKNVVKKAHTVKNKAKVSNAPKATTFQVDKSRRVDKMKPIYQEAAKSKALYQKSHSKSLPPPVNGKDSFTAASKGDAKLKVGVSGPNKLPAAGKENARGKTVVNQSTNVREIGARGMLWVQKGIKQNALQKEDQTGLFRVKGKINDQNVKKAANAVKRPHFR